MGKYLPKIVKSLLLDLGLTIEEFSQESKIKTSDIKSLFEGKNDWNVENLQKFVDYCKNKNYRNYTFDYLITDNGGRLKDSDFDVERFTVGQNGPNRTLFQSKLKSLYDEFIIRYRLENEFKKMDLHDLEFEMFFENVSLFEVSDTKEIANLSLKLTYDSLTFQITLDRLFTALKKGNLNVLVPLKESKITIKKDIHFYFEMERIIKEQLYKNADSTINEDVLKMSQFLKLENTNSDLERLIERKFKNFFEQHKKSFTLNTYNPFDLIDFGITNLEIYEFWIKKIKSGESNLDNLNTFLNFLLNFFEDPNLNETNYLTENQYWFVVVGWLEPVNMFNFLNKNYILIQHLLDAGAYIPLNSSSNNQSYKINFLKTEQLKDFIKKHIE